MQPTTERMTRSRARTLAATGQTRECRPPPSAAVSGKAPGADSCRRLPVRWWPHTLWPPPIDCPASSLRAAALNALPDKTPATTRTTRRRAAAAAAAPAETEGAVAPVVLFDVTNEQVGGKHCGCCIRPCIAFGAAGAAGNGCTHGPQPTSDNFAPACCTPCSLSDRQPCPATPDRARRAGCGAGTCHRWRAWRCAAARAGGARPCCCTC